MLENERCIQNANSRHKMYVQYVHGRQGPVIGNARAHVDCEVLQPVANSLRFPRCLESALTTTVWREWYLSWSRGVGV